MVFVCRRSVLKNNCIWPLELAFLREGKEVGNKDLLKRKERLLAKNRGNK
jgi:hypothetical protein